MQFPIFLRVSRSLTFFFVPVDIGIFFLPSRSHAGDVRPSRVSLPKVMKKKFSGSTSTYAQRN